MPELCASTRAFLIDWARRALRAHLVGSPVTPGALPDDATLCRGCFVSLHTRDGALRGCVGTFATSQPLWETVRDMAIASGCRDPRFQPVAVGELDGLRLEISVLSVLQPATPQAVVVGRHGLQVESGHRRGVLLPQVAVEHGWDRETFLRHTCTKAALPQDAWREPTTKICVFTADVFGENIG